MDNIHEQHNNYAMCTVQDWYERNKPIPNNVRCNVDDFDYLNSFTPNLVLGPECRTLFVHKVFLLQGLQGMYIFIVSKLSKESYLLLDLPAPPDCDNWVRYNFNIFVVNNTYSDPI